MQELWQPYDEAGNPVQGTGMTKDEGHAGGLHGAAHVWIWRSTGHGIEVLLQKRAATKSTWPDLWDISAAGHIDYGETPETAAIRETKEEIGLDIKAEAMVLISKRHDRLDVGNGWIENEWRWVYAFCLTQDTAFNLQISEVEQLAWKSLDVFAKEVLDPELSKQYVPQGESYFRQLLDFLTTQA